MSVAESVKRVPHKHAEVIKAWADGADIQFRTNPNDGWAAVGGSCIPGFFHDYEYRIKPEPVRTQGYRRYIDIGFDGVPRVRSCHEGAPITPARYETNATAWPMQFGGWIDTEWQYHEVEV